MMRTTLLFLLLSLFITACQFGPKDREESDIEEIPIAQYVDYEIISIDQNKGPCENDSTATNCITFNIEYPQIVSFTNTSESTDSLNQSIKQSIFDYLFVNERPTSFEDLVKEMTDEYEDVLASFPDYASSWTIEINSDVIYQDSSFISLATTIFSYTGGAHPNSNQVYRTFDLTSGRPITLSDILVKGYEDELNESAEIEFRMLKEIPPNISLEERGYVFEGGRFALNDNFAIINNSLLFYFNAYEIASYAEGPTEIELKLTDYVNLIDQNGVLHALNN